MEQIRTQKLNGPHTGNNSGLGGELGANHELFKNDFSCHNCDFFRNSRSLFGQGLYRYQFARYAEISYCHYGFQSQGNSKRSGKPLSLVSDQLARALKVTNYFAIIDKKAYLEAPGGGGMTSQTIRFSDWTAIGAESLVEGKIPV